MNIIPALYSQRVTYSQANKYVASISRRTCMYLGDPYYQFENKAKESDRRKIKRVE